MIWYFVKIAVNEKDSSGTYNLLYLHHRILFIQYIPSRLIKNY